MFIKVKNEDYGYAVATYGDYVVVSNPSPLRWNSETASAFYTGSVDYFRYNKNTDEHDYAGTIYKQYEDIDRILIAEDNGSYPKYNIDTENALSYANYDITIDKDRYTASVDNGFGLSLDICDKMLLVGSPYFTQVVMTDVSIITASGATVEIHDLGRTEYFQSSPNSYVATIYNPNLDVTESFGRGVSINNKWIAIGSPYDNALKGVVYIYRNTTTGSNYTWEFFQQIAPTGSLTDALFGWDLKLNKQSGSYSQSLVVGCGNVANGQAYYFELISGSWTQTFTFDPTTDIAPLTFGNYDPYDTTMNISNGFGQAVSIFGNSVIIGAYRDRHVYEFSGSSLYEQGSVYIFERCQNLSHTRFELVLKTYGNTSILKNNKLGYSVDINGSYAIAGIPKVDSDSITSCYLEGTLEQLYHCEADLEKDLNGQAMLLGKNTGSGAWEITNIYQKKKKYLSPYRAYGYDVSIDGRSMVIGAPLLISNSNREVNVTTLSSSGVTLDDFSGKAYIYNMKNLRDEFHVGNVFYRNGKVVVMTSGSTFNGLFFNPVNTNTYEYDLQFKGQHTIFEKQVICTVAPGEFNVSTNPSAIHKKTGSLDINGNGQFDFQDVDIILRYMQYKNTSILGVPVSTEWSSSIVKTDDERSFYNWNVSQSWYDATQTSQLASQSIVRWESTDTWMQDILDLNEDNRIDVRDMSVIWKYFSNRLTQENYSTYTTPSCKKKLFSNVLDYLNLVTRRHAIPEINHEFATYEQRVALDKTGSFLAPMATTIGLYSGLDIVAVAKLGTPVKITPELPINFVIKMDF